jgi:hypothetical protein
MAKTPTLSEQLFDQIRKHPGHTDSATYLTAMAGPTPPTFESDYLEFKTKPDADPKNTDLKKIWYEALSGFGNSGGGVLVWGIDGTPTWRHRSASRKCDNRNVGSSPGEGFVVCLIPSGPFKPYRAEISGKKQFYLRAADTFYVPSVAVLRALFYPQSRAVFQVHAKLKVGPNQERIAGRADDRLLSRCDLEIKNIGTGTARSPYLVLRPDPEPERDRTAPTNDWIFRRDIVEKWEWAGNRPVHPDSTISVAAISWLTKPLKKLTSPEIRMTFDFYCENQPGQTAEIVFESRLCGGELELSQSVTASDSDRQGTT